VVRTGNKEWGAVGIDPALHRPVTESLDVQFAGCSNPPQSLPVTDKNLVSVFLQWLVSITVRRECLQIGRTWISSWA